MKKHLLLVLGIILLIVSSCQNKKNQIVFEGQIKNAHNEQIWLAVVTNDGLQMLDSMKLEKGHFCFTLKSETEEEKARVNTPMMYQIMLSPFNTLTTLAQAGDHIVFDASADDLVDGYHVSGGEEAVLMGQLDSALNAFVHPTEQLYRKYQSNLQNDVVREEVEQQYVEMLEHHKQYLKDFIKNHPHNMASYIAFYQGYNKRSFFNEMEDLALLKQITQSLKKQYPESPYVKNMQQHVEILDLREQERKEYNDTH